MVFVNTPTGKIQLNIHNESWSTINLYSYIKIQANPQKYVPAKIKKIDIIWILQYTW